MVFVWGSVPTESQPARPWAFSRECILLLDLQRLIGSSLGGVRAFEGLGPVTAVASPAHVYLPGRRAPRP